MNLKNILIYDSKVLFEILDEIQEQLNFKVSFVNNLDYEKTIQNQNDYNLIVSLKNVSVINNILILDKYPLKISDLLKKINLNLLRNQYVNQSMINIGKYKLDLNSRTIIYEKKSIKLTEKECDLILFIKTNKSVTLKNIQEYVWNYSSDLETHTVETHIYRIRKKFLNNFNEDSFLKFDNKNYFLNIS